jgi:hypothetical protein
MLRTYCSRTPRVSAPLGALAAAMLVANGAWPQQPPAEPATPPAPTQTVVQALGQAPAAAPTPAKSGTFLAEELEQMVAPIALYPDPLLAQVLMSSTYPLEIVEAARWRKANPDLTGDAVEAALTDHDWDPSVKSIATFPDVLAMMDEKLDWTQKLGDAFLAQQAEVMAAVQTLRAKANAEGTLMSTKEQVVTVEPAPAPAAAPAADAAAPAAAAAAAPATQTTTIIKIEPADPEIVYVPTYNPTVVYGPWPYPAYPPYYYYPPMYPPGAAFFSFTAGVIIGGAFWGNCNWGSSDIDINVNRNTNINTGGNRNNVGNNAGNRGNVGNNAAGVGNNAAGVGNNAAGGGKWNHDPSHRKGAQYRDSATQNKFGKGQNANNVQSREAFRGRAEQGRQDIAAGGATRDLAGNQLGGQGGAGTRDLGGNRAGTQPATGNRAGGQGGAAAGTRPTQPSAANRPSTANRSSTSRGSEAFRSSGSGSSTRSASQRGYSSRSSGGFSGGGMSRGGGGMRGGGGRR